MVGYALVAFGLLLLVGWLIGRYGPQDKEERGAACVLGFVFALLWPLTIPLGLLLTGCYFLMNSAVASGTKTREALKKGRDK